jgi:plasmid maintenance system killer protein
MELIFEDKAYDRLDVDPSFSHGFAAPIVASYRSRIQLLRAAHAERDLTAMRCLSFQSLPARTPRQHSIHLDSHYRLIVELQRQSNGQVARIVIVRIDEI